MFSCHWSVFTGIYDDLHVQKDLNTLLSETVQKFQYNLTNIKYNPINSNVGEYKCIFKILNIKKEGGIYKPFQNLIK